MVQLASTLVAAVAGLASVSLAHPGHNVKAEAAERAAFLKRSNIARSWGDCAAKLKAGGLESRSIARREHAVEMLRRSKGLETRMQSS